MRLPSLIHGPSSSFLTTSTVCSASHPAGLLHPAAGSGVRHVSGCSPPVLTDASIDSHCWFHPSPVAPDPSKSSPRQQLLSRHRDRFPPAVPARGVSSARRKRRTLVLHGPANLRALLRCRVRCSSPTLPPTYCPILPWAFTIKAVSRQWRCPRSGPRRHPARTPEEARTDCRVLTELCAPVSCSSEEAQLLGAVVPISPLTSHPRATDAASQCRSPALLCPVGSAAAHRSGPPLLPWTLGAKSRSAQRPVPGLGRGLGRSSQVAWRLAPSCLPEGPASAPRSTKVRRGTNRGVRDSVESPTLMVWLYVKDRSKELVLGTRTEPHCCLP